MQLATMVGDANAGKVPSLNFTKVEFCDDRLDKRYFIYLFNSYRDIKRQKERELQGNGPILRIPIKSLKKLEIPVISLEKQAKIGRAYIETLKLQAKLNTYGKLVGEFTERILEKSIVKEKKMKSKSELQFEREVIDYLTKIGGVKQWEYRSEIKTTDQLWNNFKHILEQNNRARLNSAHLSVTEFNQVKKLFLR